MNKTVTQLGEVIDKAIVLLAKSIWAIQAASDTKTVDGFLFSVTSEVKGLPTLQIKTRVVKELYAM